MNHSHNSGAGKGYILGYNFGYRPFGQKSEGSFWAL